MSLKSSEVLKWFKKKSSLLIDFELKKEYICMHDAIKYVHIFFLLTE